MAAGVYRCCVVRGRDPLSVLCYAIGHRQARHSHPLVTQQRTIPTCRNLKVSPFCSLFAGVRINLFQLKKRASPPQGLMLVRFVVPLLAVDQSFRCTVNTERTNKRCRAGGGAVGAGNAGDQHAANDARAAIHDVWRSDVSQRQGRDRAVRADGAHRPLPHEPG
jgi:hypothetical protein